MMGMYPVGTMVRLATNEVGIVVRVGAAPDRPTLKVVYDSEGRAYESPYELNLDEKEDASIISSVNPAVTGIAMDAFFEKEVSASPA
jgi:hypothetical protein